MTSAVAPPLDALPTITFPVEVPPIVIVPLPFASRDNFAFEPESVTDNAVVPPVAAPKTCKPVVTDPDALTVKTGFVAPFAPTVNAAALLDVNVVSPETFSA